MEWESYQPQLSHFNKDLYCTFNFSIARILQNSVYKDHIPGGYCILDGSMDPGNGRCWSWCSVKMTVPS